MAYKGGPSVAGICTRRLKGRDGLDLGGAVRPVS